MRNSEFNYKKYVKPDFQPKTLQIVNGQTRISQKHLFGVV